MQKSKVVVRTPQAPAARELAARLNKLQVSAGLAIAAVVPVARQAARALEPVPTLPSHNSVQRQPWPGSSAASLSACHPAAGHGQIASTNPS